MATSAPSQSNQDAAEQLRNQAIDLRIVGLKPKEICQRLGRSRSWFYETLARYQSGGRDALASRSRAPHTVHNRTSPEVEAAVVRLRKMILSGEDPELRYANIGADALAVELERAGITPPSRATINRILKRYDQIQPRPRRKRKRKLPDDFPWPSVQAPNQMHLFDFVNRVIVGGTRFYGCNLLDQARRWPYLGIISSKTAVAVSQFLVSAWQEIGLPQALYLDNDPVWRGSGSGQRTISRIVRLCLWLGVEVIFIPPYTPEANPTIESFNGVWDRNFWQRTEFRSLNHVRSELPYFQEYCLLRRPLAEYGYHTADQLYPDFIPDLLVTDFTAHRQERLPLTAGRAHFIRFVTEKGTFTFLNETWQLTPEQWAGKTIRAMVDTEQQLLCVYHQTDRDTGPTLIVQYDYHLKEEVLPLA
jgi:transposase